VGFLPDFHGKGEDFLAAGDHELIREGGKERPCSIVIWEKDTRNLCKRNSIELVSEEKHPHLLLCLKGA